MREIGKIFIVKNAMRYRLALGLFLLSLGNPALARKDFHTIAHRGASGYLPEHTLPAVALAHQMGVAFIEPDLVLTKDKVLIVLHDIHLEGTTNVEEVFPRRKRKDGRYYAIDFTWKEIQRLEVRERTPVQTAHRPGPDRSPSRFPHQFHLTSLRIPSFGEYLNFIEGLNRSTGREIRIIPELKNPQFHQTEKKDLLPAFYKDLADRPYWTPDRVVVQCFDPALLKRLKEDGRFPAERLQLIDTENDGSGVDYARMLTPEGLREISEYASAIGPSIFQIFDFDDRGRLKAKKILKEARKLKIGVMPYTHRSDRIPPGLKEKDLLKSLVKEKAITGLFSDFPDRVLAVLK